MECRTTRTGCAGALLALVLAAGSAQSAVAGTLTYSGTANGTIDGTPFGTTDFTAVATFRWSADQDPVHEPIAAYPAVSMTIDLAGVGSFTSKPRSVLFAVLLQPEITGSYGAYFQDGSGDIFGNFFAHETWNAGTQSFTLSGPNDPLTNVPFTLLLPDSGSLVIDDFDSLASTAAIFAPEPAALPLLGSGLLALTLLRRGRRAS